PPETLKDYEISSRGRRPMAPSITFQGLSETQYDVMLRQIYFASLKDNEIKHKSGDVVTRALNSNRAVPKPTPGSVLAWWNHCALAPAVRDKENLYIMLTIPQLPKTAEHAAGGLVG